MRTISFFSAWSNRYSLACIALTCAWRNEIGVRTGMTLPAAAGVFPTSGDIATFSAAYVASAEAVRIGRYADTRGPAELRQPCFSERASITLFPEMVCLRTASEGEGGQSNGMTSQHEAR